MCVIMSEHTAITATAMREESRVPFVPLPELLERIIPQAAPDASRAQKEQMPIIPIGSSATRATAAATSEQTSTQPSAISTPIIKPRALPRVAEPFFLFFINIPQ